MRAVRVKAFGWPGNLVSELVSDPVPKPDEVLVDVSFANVMYVDTLVRAGRWRDLGDVHPPYVPGSGVAGTVSRVGPGVAPEWLGRDVIADIGTGGYAERAVAAESSLVEIPSGVPHELALAVLSDGATACWASDAAGFHPGAWVLVTAACGGAGSLVVQLARAAGARVVGAACGNLKLDRVRAMGAEAVVDYSQDDWADRVRRVTNGAGVSVVIDGTGGALALDAYSTLADGGTFVSYGACDGAAIDTDDDEVAAHAITMHRLEGCVPPLDDEQRLTRRALELVLRGELHPLIALTIPLDRAVDAHIVIEQRAAAGKVLLTVGG